MSSVIPKAPKGFNMHQFSTRGGQSAGIYDQLSKLFPELLQQAQGAPGAFDAMEGLAQNKFNQVTAPGIANRYAGSGIGSSSGMQNSLAAAGKDLNLSLASQRSDLMNRSMNNVLNLGSLLLQNPDVENYYSEKQKGPKWWEQALGVGLPIAGAIGGGFIPGGGIAGAKLGADIGGKIGKSFLS